MLNACAILWSAAFPSHKDPTSGVWMVGMLLMTALELTVEIVILRAAGILP